MTEHSPDSQQQASRPSRWPLLAGAVWPLLLIAGVWWFLSAGEDIEARDAQGWTALMVAAEAGHYPQVTALLKRGAEIDARDDCGWTPMMRAAAGGHLEVMECLLDHGANLHQQEKTGQNALMAAVLNNRENTTQALILRGAEVNVQEQSMGLTPLMWAARNGNAQITEWLLEAGADPDVRNHWGQTAEQMRTQPAS